MNLFLVFWNQQCASKAHRQIIRAHLNDPLGQWKMFLLHWLSAGPYDSARSVMDPHSDEGTSKTRGTAFHLFFFVVFFLFISFLCSFSRLRKTPKKPFGPRGSCWANQFFLARFFFFQAGFLPFFFLTFGSSRFTGESNKNWNARARASPTSRGAAIASAFFYLLSRNVSFYFILIFFFIHRQYKKYTTLKDFDGPCALFFYFFEPPALHLPVPILVFSSFFFSKKIFLLDQVRQVNLLACFCCAELREIEITWHFRREKWKRRHFSKNLKCASFNCWTIGASVQRNSPAQWKTSYPWKSRQDAQERERGWPATERPPPEKDRRLQSVIVVTGGIAQVFALEWRAHRETHRILHLFFRFFFSFFFNSFIFFWRARLAGGSKSGGKKFFKNKINRKRENLFFFLNITHTTPMSRVVAVAFRVRCRLMHSSRYLALDGRNSKKKKKSLKNKIITIKVYAKRNSRLQMMLLLNERRNRSMWAPL